MGVTKAFAVISIAAPGGAFASRAGAAQGAAVALSGYR